MNRAHDPGSDRYALACLAFQGLLCIGPYDGIYRPKDKSKKCVHSARPLHRHTVLNPETKYPKWATDLGLTPDALEPDLMQYFVRILHEDSREMLPVDSLRDTRWTTCPKCNATHARSSCPSCAAPGLTKTVTQARGKVTCETIFSTKGTILAAAHQSMMRWLSFENGVVRREDGAVIPINPSPHHRFRIMKDTTCIGLSRNLVLLEPNGSTRRWAIDHYGRLPLFDANSKNCFWFSGGRLLAEDTVGSSRTERLIGGALQDGTLFWVGEQFGFGFYRAGELNEFVTFPCERGILRDGLELEPIRGQLLDARCAFSSSRCWFFVSYQQSGVARNRCTLLDDKGNILATAEEDAGSDTWLGSIRGQCATGGFLFSATDEGIERVEQSGSGLIVKQTFPDTEPFVTDNCHLFAGSDGLYVVTATEIRKLTIS